MFLVLVMGEFFSHSWFFYAYFLVTCEDVSKISVSDLEHRIEYTTEVIYMERIFFRKKFNE